jgi:benzoyl-CoA reductase subunit B
MLVQKAQMKWETRPLECWNKAKQLRTDFYTKEATAKEERVWLIEGSDATTTAGIGNCHSVFCNPLGASIAAESNQLARECRAATEACGYGRDIGGYILKTLGAMFSNRGLRGAEFHKRDFVLGNAGCDMHRKHTQVVAEYYGIPFFFSDGIGYYGEADGERDEARAEFLVDQQLELIEWLEKTTGKKFDDEAFVENAKSGMRLQAFKADTMMYQQHIPAPLDQKTIYSLFILGGLVRTDQFSTEKFWEELRDEVKWRTENNIAAVATERYRFVESEPPPWFFLKYYRYMEEYGAVCIGSPYSHGVRLIEQPDGTWIRPKTALEEGLPLNTREDIIRTQLWSRSGSRGGAGHGPVHEQYQEDVLNMIKAYHGDGVILPLYRSGVGCVWGHRELAVKLEELGTPVMHYETSHPGNRTDYDENRMLDQLDVFMETQGLRKLVD